MAETKTFTFNQLPKNLDELKALPEADLSTPFKAAALSVLAFVRYTESTEDGLAMLDWLNGPKDLSGYDRQFLRDRLSGKEYVAFSYFEGTSPDNDYTPSQPYTIKVSDQVYSYQNEGYAKLFIKSSGADSARPIELRQKDSQWFLWQEMLLSDIRKPKSKSDW